MPDTERYYITIGEYYASRKPVIIRTLLGSCVAVCLYDQKRKVGGMNHILLPGKADMRHFNAPARFGVNAMELLINQIIKLGGRKEALTAKVFGGANILPNAKPTLAMGAKIVSFVKEFLELESIQIIKEDTGGTDTRTIYFHTGTGDVFLKRTSSSMAARLASKEKQSMQKLKEATLKLSAMEWFK